MELGTSKKYYAGVSPSEITPYYDMTSDMQIKNHMLVRRNIYAVRLCLPEVIWRDKHVLEIAPGSGVNAIYLAKNGAKLTLVDKDTAVIEILSENLRINGVMGNIDEIMCSDVESYMPSRKFDVIIAEGFLYFLPDRDYQLERLYDFLNKDTGLMIFHTFDPYGSFIRFVKTAYFRMACTILAVAQEERLPLAIKLFKADHEAVYTTRPFERYFRDVIESPIIGRKLFFGFEQKKRILKEKGLALFSSWPNYHERDNISWYKIVNQNDYELSCETGYIRRIPNFLCGTELQKNSCNLPTIEKAIGIRTLVLGFLDLLEGYLSGQFQAEELLSKMRAVDITRPELECHEVPAIVISMNIIKEISDLFINTLSEICSIDKIVLNYHNSSMLRRYLGTPSHYLVFHKSGKFI